MNLLCIVPREDAERLALTAFRAALSMLGEVSFQSYVCTKPSDANSPASVNSRTVAIYVRSHLVDKAVVEDTRL